MESGIASDQNNSKRRKRETQVCKAISTRIPFPIDVGYNKSHTSKSE